ncbi:MAG: glycosyltransferase family 39 protein, partial [bacterium]
MAHHELLAVLGGYLNALGSAETLGLLCALLAVGGYLTGTLHRIKSAVGGIAALALAGVAAQGLQHVFGRARPWQHRGDFHFIGPAVINEGFDSFPSGPATTCFALATFMSRAYPRWTRPVYGIAAAVALIGQVAMGRNFLSDVVGGALLGGAIGWWVADHMRPWIHSQPAPHVRESRPVPSTPSRDPRLLELGLVIAFASVILFTGLGRSALWDRDETKYAQAVIEMARHNEWMIPTVDGVPFLEKPILLYWCARLSIGLWGADEFGFRFPSALLGVLTCVIVYLLGRTLRGRRTGLLSAIILSSSFLFVGGFHLLLADPLLVFFTTLSFLFYVYSLDRTAWIAGSYLAIGLAVLSKGPIGFFPAPIFLMFEWMRGNSRSPSSRLQSLLKHVGLSFLAVAVAAPWFMYSFRVQEQASSSFFLYDNVARFLRGMEGHTGPMLYYVLIL